MLFGDFFAARRGAKQFRQFVENARCITFYAEDAASHVHYAGLIDALKDLGCTIAYLTSDKGDPILEQSAKGVHAFYIGSGTVRTSLFLAMDVPCLVMTMPDLESFHIKRSVVADVNYVYLFHSIVSTHLIYRKGAFDHFDTVLTVGPHHDTEIRQWEVARELPKKNLIAHGYGRLDDMRDEVTRSSLTDSAVGGPVLLAPSWGPTCILETIGIELCQVLVDAGLEVVVRPHPMTVRQHPEIITALENQFGSRGLTVETDVRGFESMTRCSAMISDWSGVAFEYAFAFERPVLFIDTPKKTRNEDWQSIEAVPVEIDFRDQLGSLVGIDELHTVPEKLESIQASEATVINQIRQARESLIHNFGCSAVSTAATLAALVKP